MATAFANHVFLRLSGTYEIAPQNHFQSMNKVTKQVILRNTLTPHYCAQLPSVAVSSFETSSLGFFVSLCQSLSALAGACQPLSAVSPCQPLSAFVSLCQRFSGDQGVKIPRSSPEPGEDMGGDGRSKQKKQNLHQGVRKHRTFTGG